MTESIMSNEPVCFVCDTTEGLHRHHIFHGTANRKLSEQYGCWCYLCGRHHNLSIEGVHFNAAVDLRLKQMCQERWEVRFGDRSAFIKTFGKSYL